MIKKAVNNSSVNVSYTGWLDNGTIFDQGSVAFKIGSGQVIPGFDKAVIGMSAGETKTIRLSPIDAYGTYSDLLIINVSRDYLNATTGDTVMTNYGPARVIAVNEANITIDLNHPLAGKTLNFNLTLLSIN